MGDAPRQGAQGLQFAETQSFCLSLSCARWCPQICSLPLTLPPPGRISAGKFPLLWLFFPSDRKVVAFVISYLAAERSGYRFPHLFIAQLPDHVKPDELFLGRADDLRKFLIASSKDAHLVMVHDPDGGLFKYQPELLLTLPQRLSACLRSVMTSNTTTKYSFSGLYTEIENHIFRAAT